MSTEQTGQPCPKCGEEGLTQETEGDENVVVREVCKACGFIHDLKNEVEVELKRV
jgi:predicted RNA-binding Zn-ribbon protein involved in translation (DUF1610 family)